MLMSIKSVSLQNLNNKTLENQVYVGKSSGERRYEQKAVFFVDHERFTLHVDHASCRKIIFAIFWRRFAIQKAKTCFLHNIGSTSTTGASHTTHACVNLNTMLLSKGIARITLVSLQTIMQ